MHGPAFGTAKCSPPEGITLNGYHIPGGTELSVQLYPIINVLAYYINNIILWQSSPQSQ